MKKYNPIAGVPRFCYYLKEVVRFADFEGLQEERIMFTSRNKQELIDLCIQNNWSHPEAHNIPLGTGVDWNTHHIEYRGLW